MITASTARISNIFAADMAKIYALAERSRLLLCRNRPLSIFQSCYGMEGPTSASWAFLDFTCYAEYAAGRSTCSRFSSRRLASASSIASSSTNRDSQFGVPSSD